MKAVSDRELNYLTEQIMAKLGNTVPVDDVVSEATPNKILRLTDDNKLPTDITGSAAKLAQAITMALSGDVSGEATFDGSSNINITVTVDKLSGPLVLNSEIFGPELPTTNLVEGRLFFKQVIE